MESDVSNMEIFHIGDMNSEITIEELVHFIGGLVDYNGTYEQQQAHSGSVSRRCPDTSKAERLLKYSPRMNWKDGVKITVDWYIKYIKDGELIFE